MAARQSTGPGLILASASPRRRDLLAALGARFTVVPADVDESPREGEAADAMVLRLAAAKAFAVAAPEGGIVLGADTAVVLDGEVFGKPVDEADGTAMLSRLSGRTHEVLSGVALRRGAAMTQALSRTTVRFRDIRPAEARRYWRSGEPAGKAGGYAIQGFGGLFVASIMGSYSGVVGLPIFETATLLREAGIDLLPDD
jgi:nucleoside triphosphate pyrophosphatase